MSGPLPQHRHATKATKEVKGYKTIIDKVHPGAKGERTTYTFKDVPLFKHIRVEKAQPQSKHRNGRMTPERAAHEAFVARVQKKVKKAFDWMQKNDKGWQAAVDEGLVPQEVAEKMGLLGGPS